MPDQTIVILYVIGILSCFVGWATYLEDRQMKMSLAMATSISIFLWWIFLPTLLFIVLKEAREQYKELDIGDYPDYDDEYLVNYVEGEEE